MPRPKTGESKQKFLKRCTEQVIHEGKEADQAYAICNSYWDKSSAGQAGLADEDTNSTNLAFQQEVTLAPKKDDPKEGESKKRVFQTTAYAGQVVDRWWSKLILDVAGMKAAKNSIPALRNHDTDKIVGHSTGVWKDDSHFYVTGEVSDVTADGREVAALADEGFPWQASVRVSVTRKEILEDEKQTAEVNGMTLKGPLEIWRDTVVEEVSFVPFGADNRTAGIVMSTSGELERDDDETQNQIGEIDMDKKELIAKLVEKGYATVDMEKLSVGTLERMVDALPTENGSEGDTELAQRDQTIETLNKTIEDMKAEMLALRQNHEDAQATILSNTIQTELLAAGVPGDIEKIVTSLVTLHGLDEQLYEDIKAVLLAAGVAVMAAGTFQERGTGTSKGSPTKASEIYALLQEKKEELMRENPNLKEPEAWHQTIRKNSELYRNYNKLRNKELSKVQDDDTGLDHVEDEE